MIRRSIPFLVAVALLAGCGKTTTRPAAGLKGSAAVAVFRGYLADQPAVLRQHVAVANVLGDDLKFLDAQDAKVVLAPTLVGALAVPVRQRPAVLAAGPLNDLDGAGNPLARPDLLLVASRGLFARDPLLHPGQSSARLQVITTWDPVTHVALEVDLGDVAPDAEILSVVTTGIREPTATGFRLRPGAVRAFLGMTGGLLVTVDFERAADGLAIELAAPAGPPNPAVQALGFDALGLGPSPDAASLYVATRDPIPGPGGVLGVAELDLSQPVGALTVRAIPAGPTTDVVAMTLKVFKGFTSGDATLDVFEDQPSTRVYALLAPDACGRDAPLQCGLAVIDPVVGGLAADPAGQAPHMNPIQIPGEGLAMAATGPSALQERAGFLKIAPGSGQRYTTGLIAVASTAGHVYLVDPGHLAVANDVSMLNGNSRTRVSSAATKLPLTATGGTQPTTVPLLGLWNEKTDPAHPVVVTGASSMMAQVKVTPGFTNSETWSVSYQGILPGLGDRTGQVRSTGPAIDWIAVQEATGLTGAGQAALRSVAHLYDPRLAVRGGDLVVVNATGLLGTDGQEACPKGPFELRVTGLLPPTADYPGGAVSVVPADVQPRWSKDSTGAWIADSNASPADPHCLDARSTLPAGDRKAVTTFRARALVAVGTVSGYAGRPDLVEGDPTPVPPFALEYEREDALSCPILLDRDEDWPPPAAAVSACQADVATCRSQCERLLLARRSRRIYYLTDRCLDAATSTTAAGTCGGVWTGLTFPFPAGPAVAFKVGLLQQDGSEPPAGTLPLRESAVVFATANGISPASREPYSGTTAFAGVLPTGVAFYDEAAEVGTASLGVRGFAAFTDNLVLDFSPAQPAPNATVVR
ncbi:MAG TPA: hypothetical protein VFP50_10055 [Anaeromyxobacteraceae bacterium]|nr:hypothetical protein [Anaeromyxobacteraceae bacterium]